MTNCWRGTFLKTVLLFMTTCIAYSASAAFAQAQVLDPDSPYQGIKSSSVTYQVDLSAVVTPPYKCKVLKIWMPIPPTDAAQEVSKSVLSSFPMKVEPKIGAEKTYGNRFAFFEFHNPQGAQIVRHQFQVKTWQVHWNVDLAKVQEVDRWPRAFDPYLRGERLVPKDERFAQLAMAIVPKKTNAAQDMAKVMDWVNSTLVYSHKECSLQGSAVHALDKKIGHCSDYHGLCTALGRNLGYPTRIVYGINPYTRNSPSHCKLEAYLPPYGWVAFDVSETQILIGKIQKDAKLSDTDRIRLSAAARDRLVKGFRDNTWFLQTRGSGYDLEPPAKQKAAVVRTIYAEADGVAYPEPDPANPEQTAFSWMTVHNYSADRQVTNPFQDWRSLEK
ncbi:MAG: transglutaminase-like domain-containing protein [Gemmataceae bacterium]|nr:transglutaminase-like domain-containing protein [Gemmataceae bacterium]MCI0743682.1 transglutaminase-like domain-containing protein [Gemmataceae bacterium]